MGCATAVLASKVGGIPEVVQDGITGELVEYSENSKEFESALAEAVTRLTGDPELLRKYGKAGRARAISEFGWESVAAQTVSLYGSVIHR